MKAEPLRMEMRLMLLGPHRWPRGLTTQGHWTLPAPVWPVTAPLPMGFLTNLQASAPTCQQLEVPWNEYSLGAASTSLSPHQAQALPAFPAPTEGAAGTALFSGVFPALSPPSHTPSPLWGVGTSCVSQIRSDPCLGVCFGEAK